MTTCVDFSSVRFGFQDAKAATPASRSVNLGCLYSTDIDRHYLHPTSASFPRVGGFFSSLRPEFPRAGGFFGSLRQEVRAPTAFLDTSSTSPRLRPSERVKSNPLLAPPDRIYTDPRCQDRYGRRDEQRFLLT